MKCALHCSEVERTVNQLVTYGELRAAGEGLRPSMKRENNKKEKKKKGACKFVPGSTTALSTTLADLKHLDRAQPRQ